MADNDIEEYYRDDGEDERKNIYGDDDGDGEDIERIKVIEDDEDDDNVSDEDGDERIKVIDDEGEDDIGEIEYENEDTVGTVGTVGDEDEDTVCDNEDDDEEGPVDDEEGIVGGSDELNELLDKAGIDREYIEHLANGGISAVDKDLLDYISGKGDVPMAVKQRRIAGYNHHVQPPWIVKKNDLISYGSMTPDGLRNPEARCTLSHREYISDILGPTGTNFSPYVLAIQPGSANTFPWLSTVSRNFEQYKFRGLIFEYISTSADAISGTNTALGTVIMATQYDATKPSYANKQQMENSEYAISAKPSYNIMHPIECESSDDALTTLYVRQDYMNAGSNFDIRMYDMGNLYVAATGMQNLTGYTLGELWVNYTVELIKTTQLLPGPDVIETCHITSTAGISTSNYFGTNQVVSTGSNLYITTSTGGVNMLYGDGYYLVFYYVSGSSASTTVPTIAALFGCNLINMWVGDTKSAAGSGSAVTNTVLSVVFIVNVTNQVASMGFSGGTLPASPTSMDLYVTSVNSSVVKMDLKEKSVKQILSDVGKLGASVKEKLKVFGK